MPLDASMPVGLTHGYSRFSPCGEKCQGISPYENLTHLHRLFTSRPLGIESFELFQNEELVVRLIVVTP